MIRKTHKIRRINVAIALAATVAASLVLIVPSASAGVRPDDRSSPRGQGASSPAELSLDQATTDAVRSMTRGSVRPNDRVDLRTTPGVDGGAASTRSAGDDPFDARNVLGLALFLAVFGLGIAAMITRDRGDDQELRPREEHGMGVHWGRRAVGVADGANATPQAALGKTRMEMSFAFRSSGAIGLAPRRFPGLAPSDFPGPRRCAGFIVRPSLLPLSLRQEERPMTNRERPMTCSEAVGRRHATGGTGASLKVARTLARRLAAALAVPVVAGSGTAAAAGGGNRAEAFPGRSGRTAFQSERDGNAVSLKGATMFAEPTRKRKRSRAGAVLALAVVAAALLALPAPAAAEGENDAITFGAATWVDLQRVTGADPLVDVDSRRNGRVFVNFPWGRLTTPTLPNIVARSLDGGDTFRTLFDEKCATSNSQPRCGDPGWGNSTLALSPDNDNVYLSGIAPGFEAISASASSNAGDTWPNFNPVTTPGVMDRPWLLAPGGQKAYLEWNNVALTGPPSVQYATTQDGGASWTVDPYPKYAAGAATRLVMDRSAQSPARGAIYQVFGKLDPLGLESIPEVGIAVSRDDTKTFQTYRVGEDLACGTCHGGTDYRGWSLPWVTTDSGGNLYAVWGTGSGSDVVMSTSNISDLANDPTRGGNPGSTWSPKVRVSTGAAETAVVGNVVAGSPGNVAIVYYGTRDPRIPEDQPADAEWYPFVAHSSNALSSSPAFTQSVIGHRAVHKGGLCTVGSGSCPREKSQDRGLRNWMNVGFDPDGRLYAAWSDDNNSGKRTAIRFAKQLTGPSLMAGKPPFDEPAPSSSMTDPSGDATWPNRITGGTNLPGADLTRVALRNNGKDIRFKLSVGNANQFQKAVDEVPSADRLLFVVRFQSADEDYFAAYEHSTDGTDRAFTGRIDANDRVEANDTVTGGFENAIAFLANDPQSNEATWTVDSNTITITQQLSAFEGLVASPAASPPKLLSVVGSALIGPSEANETRFKLLNTLDATRAFDSE